MNTNIIDQPAKAEEDRLNMRAYGEALTEFIENARAPLTIALQGEWGSGKTSLMNSLKQSLVDKDGAPYYGVWINTWQYSVMSNPEQAVLRLLAGIIAQISGHAKKESAESRQKVLRSFAKVAAVSFGNIAGKVVGLGEIGTEIRKACDAGDTDGNQDDLAGGESQIEILKRQLQDLVNSCVADGKKGFVFFIDDLDRIDPPVAVQILELLKNIFDLENCIFVLAIDYGVVVKGLKPKFGEMSVENELEFRSFFDKIIQLPFAMPVGAYQIDDFLLDSLSEIGYLDSTERADSCMCDALTAYALESVGTNPRSLKRLINTLSLIRLLILRTHTKDDDADFQKWKDVSFALVCLQIQYPQVYAALERFPDFGVWDERFAQTMRLAQLSEEEVKKLNAMEEFDEPWEQMLFRFCRKDAFLEARALNISKTLNRIKARILGAKELIGDTVESLLKLSAVTNVKSEPERAVVEEFNKSEYLKIFRQKTLGLHWAEDNRGAHWESNLSDRIWFSSWQSRVQSNLSTELWLRKDCEGVPESPFLTSPSFKIIHDGNSFLLKISGEFWGTDPNHKFAGINFKDALVEPLAVAAIEKFKSIWSEFGVVGNIGYWDQDIWWNVTVPFASKDELVCPGFGEKLRIALTNLGLMFEPFLKFRKPQTKKGK